MTTAVDAEHAIWLRRPVVHDSEEVIDVGRCEEPIDNGDVVVVGTHEVVKTAIEAPRVVIEGWSGYLCRVWQVAGEGAHVDLHVFERSAANATTAATPGNVNARALEALLTGIVLAVAGE